MSIKVSFRWFLWLQHITLSFFQKSLEKLIRVKNPSKWSDTELKPRHLNLFHCAGLHIYTIHCLVAYQTKHKIWRDFFYANVLMEYIMIVEVQDISLLLSVSEFRLASQKHTKKTFFMSFYVVHYWACSDLWILFVVFRLKSPTAEFTTSNDNSPKCFFHIWKLRRQF